MALNAYARTTTNRVVVPAARVLVRLGVTPNAMTTLGLVLTAAGTAILLAGWPIAGGLALTVGVAIDAFDGAVARLQHRETALGSFYDSVADRVSDGILFAAAAWLVVDRPLLFAVAMVAFTAAFLTSYMRAKAESLGCSATVGLVERPERLILLIPGLVFGWLAVALPLLAIGGIITVGQRARVVLRQARAR